MCGKLKWSVAVCSVDDSAHVIVLYWLVTHCVQIPQHPVFTVSAGLSLPMYGNVMKLSRQSDWHDNWSKKQRSKKWGKPSKACLFVLQWHDHAFTTELGTTCQPVTTWQLQCLQHSHSHTCWNIQLGSTGLLEHAGIFFLSVCFPLLFRCITFYMSCLHNLLK